MGDESKNMRHDLELDSVDRQILNVLQINGRITNAELAERVGIAASTCIARVRSLVSRQIITGFTADVNPGQMGLALEVLVNVAVDSNARGRLSELTDELRELRGVLQIFFLAGAEDFLIHLAARDSDDVRAFVTDHLSSNPAFASTRTSLVFSHHRNPVTVP